MDSEQWKAIKKKGIFPTVTSKEDYVLKMGEGIMDAITYQQSAANFIPNAETLKTIHYNIFKKVTPWAGKFTPNPLITNGYITCDPRLLEKELNRLGTAWEVFDVDKKNPQEIAKAIAFTGARILRLHPFLDGNKRTICTTITRLTELHLPLVNPIQQMSTALFEARKGNIKPLGTSILNACDIPNVLAFNWTLPSTIVPPQPEALEELEKLKNEVPETICLL